MTNSNKFNNRLSLFRKIAKKSYCLDINYLKNFYFKHNKKYSFKEIKDKWIVVLKDQPKIGNNLNLYISIPFCANKKCNYCRHPSLVANSGVINLYLNYLNNELKYYSQVFKNKIFNNLYIGGGTPSILTEKQLANLLSYIFHYYNFNPQGEKSFECNPTSTNYKKLQCLKKFQINRISIGVQSLNADVLKRANRLGQDYQGIKKIIEQAKQLKFNLINVDLIIGLKGDNLKSIVDTCQKILKLQPSTVYLYKYKPQITHFTNYLNESVDSYYKRASKLFNELYNLLNDKIAPKYQYRLIKSDDDFKLEANLGQIDYSQTQYAQYSDARQNSILGLGQFANSYIYNVFHGEEKNKDLFFNEVKKSIFGSMLPKTYEVSKYIFYCLEHNNSLIPLKKFKELFKVDPLIFFSGEVNYLISKGKVKVDKEFIYYLPRSIKERFIYAMFFIDQSYLL